MVRSGDVGQFDDAGYLRIIGRLKELIISGGYNVDPVEVEEVLRAHPGVEDVAVVGRAHPDWGEQVTAYLVGDPSAEAGILGFAAARLAAYKRPKQLRFVPELPRNALGEGVRNDLP